MLVADLIGGSQIIGAKRGTLPLGSGPRRARLFLHRDITHTVLRQRLQNPRQPSLTLNCCIHSKHGELF
jgi:hypothetical protein